MRHHGKAKEELERELTAIYAREDGTMPDLTQLQAAPDAKWRRRLVRALLVVGALSAASWAGFFAWTRFSGSDIAPLTAAVEGPESVRALEEVTYAVRYHGAGDVPLAQLEVTLNLPDAFQVASTVPSPDEGSTWRVGSLTPGSDGEILVTGSFRDAVPSAQTLQASFTYRPANFSSDFRDFRSLPVHVDGTMLEAAVTGPEKTLPGDKVTYAIEVRNGAKQAAEGVRLVADLPKDFRFLSSVPEPAAPGTAAWDLPAIAPGETAAVSVTGSYTASAEGTQAVTARMLLLTEGRELTQGEAIARTDILGSAFDFHLVVNGGTTDVAEAPGTPLRLSIDYANRGTDTLGDVSFRLTADPGAAKALPIDWAAAVGVEEGVRVSNALTWNKAVRPELAALAPASEGVIDLTLPLLKDIDPGAVTDRFTLQLIMSVQKVGSVVGARSVSVTPITVSLNSDFSALAEARYFTPEGEPVGQGPLPPKAGESTTYRVYWTLQNRLHPLAGTRMSATLPTDAGWVDHKDANAGAVSYDDTTRTVSWTVDAWPEGMGTVQAWFDVTTAPNEADVGSYLKLVNAAGAEATDTVTKARLTRVLPELTSELPTDADAKGKGVVAPKE